MRIVSWDLAPYRTPPPARVFASARGAWGAREGLLLYVRDERGHLGQGEAAPLPGYSPDALEEARADLERVRNDVLSVPFDDCLPPASQVARLDRRLACRSPAARCALQTALLDLAGQRLRVPVSTLLAGRPVESAVPLAWVIGAGAADAAVEEMRGAWREGYRSFKCKLARPDRSFEDDLRLVTALRLARPEAELRCDVNGAWNEDQARERLARLRNAQIAFVEEPVPAGALGELTSDLPLAADESLQDPARAERIVAGESRAVSVVVLKPGALGGPLPCHELASRARRAGLEVVISHLLEGPVGLASAAELALALGPGRYAAGLTPWSGLAAWQPDAIPQRDGAWLRPADHPGLGLPPVVGPPEPAP